MICAGCGAALPERPERQPGCGQCRGSCRKIHCPYCGHENPLIPSYLRRLQAQDDKPKE